MTETNTTPETERSDAVDAERAAFFRRSSKAIAGGIAGAATALGTAIGTALADGAMSEGETWQVIAAVVGGFALGFGAVYAAPANKS